MDLIELNVLGAFRINCGGQTLTIATTDKERALLTYLALEGTQPRAALTALLWPYLSQETAFDHLRKLLYRLRRKLDAEMPGASALLIADHQNLQLDAARIVVDALRFQSLLTVCQQHPHAKLTACDDCLARLADAADCYQGELLSGLALGDAPMFEEWLLLRREALHHQALQSLASLSTAWEARGENIRAQDNCSRILALDPLIEEAHRQQMRLFVLLGQRNRALQHYQTFRRLLREELGVEPEAATVALFEQIRSGDLPLPALPQVAPLPEATNPRQWGDVPEMGRVYGREKEMAQLQRWLGEERCQVVAILGLGGVGKSTLAAAAANTIATDFDPLISAPMAEINGKYSKVIWRSLLNALPFEELLSSVLRSIAQQPWGGLPSSLDEQLALLLSELRQQRCLLILDNLESILQPEGIGEMRAGYEGYMQLIRQMAEKRHNSSLLLTSREQAQDMARWEKDLSWVRSLLLEGIARAAGQAILASHGLNSQVAAADSLMDRYSGHPLALKLVAETIQELFGGDIAAFLTSDVVIFDDIRAVLDQQFGRLPLLEQEVLFWLAEEREPITLVQVCANLTPVQPMRDVVQALRALQRRSLVQAVGHSSSLESSLDPSIDPGGFSVDSSRPAKFTSPHVIMEYLADRLVQISYREIEQEELSWLQKVALVQVNAEEHLRQSQMRGLLEPLARRIEALWGHEEIGQKIVRILYKLRHKSPMTRGYGAGNLLNLLTLLKINVGALDLVGLSIWQADLREARLAGSNLAATNLRGSRFANAFSWMRAVAFSPDGELVAGGSQDGELLVWDAESGHLLQVYRGHEGSIRSIAFSADGRLLASGGEDQIVCLWSIGQPSVASSDVERVRVLNGHTARITAVAFHPNGKTVASGSADGTVRIWDSVSGETRAIFHAHEIWVWTVAFSPDGSTLATGGADHVIRLWDTQTTELRATLAGHNALVSALAFDPTGSYLSSGSFDCRVSIWEVATSQTVRSFKAATDWVTSVAFSPDGKSLATSGDDRMIRLWNMQTGDLTSVFQGHRDAISCVAFSPNGETIVSSGGDQQICLWDVQSGRICRLLSGNSQAIDSIAFHPNGKLLASGHHDHIVRLWDLETNDIRQSLYDHSLSVKAVAFSADGAFLASGGDDKSIQLWGISALGYARHLASLLAHQRDVGALDFHPDGRTLFSGSEDQTIGFWVIENGKLRRLLQVDNRPLVAIKVDPTGKLLADTTLFSIQLRDALSGFLYSTLKSHVPFTWSLAFSPDGQWLASGGSDGSIEFWDVRDPAQAEYKFSLQGHSDRVYCIAFHPNGRFLASGGADHAVQLWDMQTHKIVHTLIGHTQYIWTLAFSPDGRTIASSGWDATVRLWDSESGEALAVLHTPGPYAGMNIRGASGISDAVRTTLKRLGAIEQ